MTAAPPTPPAPDEPDLDALLALALEAAVEAGAVLLADRPGHGGGPLEIGTKSSPTDVVTDRDRAAEALLVGRLIGARPHDAVLGEEGGERAGTSGLRWVLDPLDGTVNYLYGLPMWSVSVACESTATGEALVGVVHAPALGETYLAVRGRGALRRDADGEFALRVPGTADLAAALVGTGFGYRAERRAAQSRVLAALLPQVRDVRRAGAASIDLCWVASGYLDAYYERGLQPWDHAAGALVAREAGARVEGLDGAAASDELTIAAAPGLFGPLHDVLRGLRAATDEA